MSNQGCVRFPTPDDSHRMHSVPGNICAFLTVNVRVVCLCSKHWRWKVESSSLIVCLSSRSSEYIPTLLLHNLFTVLILVVFTRNVTSTNSVCFYSPVHCSLTDLGQVEMSPIWNSTFIYVFLSLLMCSPLLQISLIHCGYLQHVVGTWE